MRIGITCYPTYGGSGAVATELGLDLARRGHRVHFISYAQPFRLTQFIDGVYFHEVKVNPYPLFDYPPYSLALAVKMHEVAVQESLDLLHVHYAIPHATAAWVARDMLRGEGKDVKLVTTLHGTDITLVGSDPSYRSITRFSIQKSDRLTAVSAWLRDRTHEDLCNKCQIDVIPNFINPDLYDRSQGGDFRLAQPGEKVIMHISNFRSVKRVSDVVRVFHRIHGKMPARLILVGDGPDRHKAEILARRMGIGDQVIALGKIESVAELLVHADLFLLPSEQESFGLVALEAHASGVPVVGTSGTGLGEVVRHGETGFLHPVGDVDSMGHSAVALLQDTVRWEEASRAARAQVVKFTASSVVPRYERLYRDLVSGKDREPEGPQGASA